MRLFLISFLCICGVSLYAQPNDDYTKGILDFEILNLEGESFTHDQLTTDDYKLLMYFNPSCSSCQKAFKDVNTIADKCKELPVHFYPISLGNKHETIDFLKKYAPDFKDQVEMTVLREKNYQFSDLYEVNAYPTFFLYKPDNSFVKSYMGYSKATDFLKYFDKKQLDENE